MKKAIITVAGSLGSGKSSTAKAVAAALGFKHYSSGDLFRQIAKDRGVSVEAINLTAEVQQDIDRQTDEWLKHLGQSEENFVVDSRMAWHWMPNAFKVFLFLDPAVAAQRIFADIQAGKRVSEYGSTVEEVRASIDRRFGSEQKRYFNLYGIDPTDPANHDLVIDTKDNNLESVVAIVLAAYAAWRKEAWKVIIDANMNPITVLFFGSQGAGKGTQVKMLIDYLQSKSDRGVIRIDMGQELRNLRDTGSYAGTLTGEVIDNGGRMPDFMPIYLQTKVFVDRFTGQEHIVADGLARGPDQTRGFDDMMQFFSRAESFQIISLAISDDSSVQRLLARGRNDDTEEAIRRRLAWTKTDVMPQIELLKSRGRVVHEIDGEPDVDTIHKNILAALGLEKTA